MKGLGAVKEANKNSVNNLKLKDGQSAVVRVLSPADEIVSVYEHVKQFNGQWKTVTCIGKNDCPLCQSGDYASFKSYLVVADRNDNDKVKIFKASKRVGMQLIGLVEEYGDLTKRDFKITRQGNDVNTTYQFFARDPQDFDFESVQLPEVEKMVEPMTRDAILALMNGGGEVTNVDNSNGSTGNPDTQAEGGNKSGGDDDFPF